MFDNLPLIPGEDPAFLDVIEHVSRLAAVEKPCLIVGERGTGKELFTTRVHYLSPRWEGPIIKVNCAALTESLLDTELFGHEAGAFTGATRRHVGCFERANGGSLVLDEIASASIAVQEKILRVIEYGEIQRVGGRETLNVDVRIIAASNVDLPSLASRGAFRPDLLDRLSFDVVTLPPLRARPSDIVPLARGFGLKITQQLGREVFAGFSAGAEAALLGYPWPGNIRELKNVVERSLYRAAPGEVVDALIFDPFESPWRPQAHVPYRAVDAATDDRESGGVSGFSDRSTAVLPTQRSHASGEWQSARTRESRTPPMTSPVTGQVAFADAVAAFERGVLLSALEAAQFNQTRTAESLGLSYHQLRRLLAKHELRPAALG